VGWTTLGEYMQFLMLGAYPRGPLGGLALTVYLSVVAGLSSFGVGLLGGLARNSSRKYLRLPATIYVEVIRGIPFIMVLFWFYFLVPRILQHTITENTAAFVGITFFFGAYATEIVRAGIMSVDKGQVEAGLSSGLFDWQVMLFIILPQALRNMIPSFVNLYVSLIKDTSLIFFIGVTELTGAATQVMRREVSTTVPVFILLFAVYLILCSTLNSFSDRLEARLASTS
jgi:polar amino acid transport system permease protein